MAEIPIQDNQGKDVTVNFKMYDGFDANKTFYTDANGLEMMERKVDWNPAFPVFPDPETKQHVSGNYYPVTSAIIMRDLKKHRQITVMPDRT